MQSIKSLIRAANPVSEDRSEGLPSGAEDTLAAILAASPAETATGPRPSPRRRGVRRGHLVIAAAAVVLTAVASGAAFLAAANDPARPTAIEPFFRTAPSLENRAETIVRATIRATRPEDVDGMSVTVATAAVSAVAKGGASVNDEIEFAYTTPGSAPEAPTNLRVGGEYILLLAPSTESPAFLVSSIQGCYAVLDDKAVPDRSNPVTLSAEIRKKLGLA